MKKYLYEISIFLLSICLLLSFYFLYEKEPNKIKDNIIAKKEDTFTKTTNKKLNVSNAQISDRTNKIESKMTDLKSTLEKTEVMLKNYNYKNEKIIIKDADIDRLVSLDLKLNDNPIKELIVEQKNSNPKKVDENNLMGKKEIIQKTNIINNTQYSYSQNKPSENTLNKSEFEESSLSNPSTSNTSQAGISSDKSLTDSTYLNEEIEKFRVEIDSLKKTIKKININ